MKVPRPSAAWLRAFAAAIVIAAQAGSASAAPEVGWWWNPDESGRGYFIESEDGIFFMAAYFYADDGRARWLVAGGANADPYNYSGTLYEVSDGQTLYGPYVAPSPPVDSGVVTVTFSDDIHGTIDWPGGSIPIVREIFDAGTASFQPESGWWWDPNQSGSGYSIEVQGGRLFIVGFMYDDAGNPVWYLSAGLLSTPTTYHGDLLQVAGGQTESGPYHPPSTVNTIGTLDVTFTAVDQATLVFTETAAARADQIRPLAGRTSQRNLQRQFKHPPYIAPNSYAGSYTVTDVSHQQSPAEHIDITYITSFQNVVWQLDPEIPLPGQHAYGLKSGSIHVEFSESESTIGGDFCTASLTIDQDLTKLPGKNFTLTVSDRGQNGHYSLVMLLTPGDIIANTTLSCNSGLTAPVPVIPIASGTWDGNVTGNGFKNGGKLTTSSGPGSTQTITYVFGFTAGPSQP